MAGLRGKKKDEKECEEIDWDDSVSEILPGKDQVVGWTKLDVAET